MFNETLARCEEIMHKVYAGFEAELKEFNDERDHVHLLAHHLSKPTRTASTWG